jgi:hypothetical protein
MIKDKGPGRNHASQATQQQRQKQVPHLGTYLVCTSTYIHTLGNKSASHSFGTAAKKIIKLNHENWDFESTLLKLYSCYKKAQHWDDLSPAERILLEIRWTDSADELLTVGNIDVMHSLRYRLREQIPEEDDDISENY